MKSSMKFEYANEPIGGFLNEIIELFRGEIIGDQDDERVNDRWRWKWAPRPNLKEIWRKTEEKWKVRGRPLGGAAQKSICEPQQLGNERNRRIFVQFNFIHFDGIFVKFIKLQRCHIKKN